MYSSNNIKFFKEKKFSDQNFISFQLFVDLKNSTIFSQFFFQFLEMICKMRQNEINNFLHKF